MIDMKKLPKFPLCESACENSYTEDFDKNSIQVENNRSSLSNIQRTHENVELTNILNSFTQQSSPRMCKSYDYQSNDGPPPLINILAENYRIKLTEKLSNCNSKQNEQKNQFFNPIIPILYIGPHIPQNKRHVHFIPHKNDVIPKNATVFDFNAALAEHNERIIERQELAIAYAEMLCSDVSSSPPASSRISPCFKYSSQRSSIKITFDRSQRPKNSRSTLPTRKDTKKKIKIYQVKDQSDKPNFSDCYRESFYFQQNGSYNQSSSLNDALSICRLNVPNPKTTQLANHNFQNHHQKKQNIKKNPSLSKPQCYRNSNGNNKCYSSGCSERENSSLRSKRNRGPLHVISQNNFEYSFSDSTNENQNKFYNKYKEGYY